MTRRNLPLNRPTRRVGIVDRAASILDCFSRSAPEWTLPQMSRRLTLPKATTFRLLTNLVRHGLLEHNASANLYTLGFGTLRLADVVLQSLAIRAQARPAMQAIRDAVNETVVLSVRDGDNRYNVDSVESTHAIGQTQQIGVAIPLYAGAASRVLLAAMSDDEIDAYLARVGRNAFSATTITDPSRLADETARIRRRGFATSSGEFTPHGHAVARAILDRDGRAAGALHVSIPETRFSKAMEKRCADALLEGMRKMESGLAGRNA
jgi:DNA-binding IclR family transcriptional regulator